MVAVCGQPKFLRGWQDVIEVPFPQLGPVTEETRQAVQEDAERFRGSVRLRMGQFYTDAEREALSKD